MARSCYTCQRRPAPRELADKHIAGTPGPKSRRNVSISAKSPGMDPSSLARTGARSPTSSRKNLYSSVLLPAQSLDTICFHWISLCTLALCFSCAMVTLTRPRSCWSCSKVGHPTMCWHLSSRSLLQSCWVSVASHAASPRSVSFRISSSTLPSVVWRRVMRVVLAPHSEDCIGVVLARGHEPEGEPSWRLWLSERHRPRCRMRTGGTRLPRPSLACMRPRCSGKHSKWAILPETGPPTVSSRQRAASRMATP